MTPEKANIPIFDQRVETEREKTHRKIFSKVSHDLRTPLSLIIGSLEIYERMKDKFTEEKKNTLIELAIQEAYKLDNFITNILDMENLESKLVIPKKEAINIADLIDECIKTPTLRLNDNNITITTEIEDILVNSDSALVRKVMISLLDNAVKYAGNGASILVECNAENNNAVVKIHDNGPGISGPYIESVFDKYKKLGANSRSNASIGLGLTISREIMSLLGGQIKASNSNKYSGALFTVILPV